MKLAYLWIVIVPFLALAQASGATIEVTQGEHCISGYAESYSSLDGGVQKSSQGDTVVVCPGEYTISDQLSITEENLYGHERGTVVVKRGQVSTGSTVRLGDNTLLGNVTLTSAPNSKAVYIKGENIAVEGVAIADGFQHGFYISSSSNVSIRDSHVYEASSAALEAHDSQGILFQSSRIILESGYVGKGVALHNVSSSNFSSSQIFGVPSELNSYELGYAFYMNKSSSDNNISGNFVKKIHSCFTFGDDSSSNLFYNNYFECSLPCDDTSGGSNTYNLGSELPQPNIVGGSNILGNYWGGSLPYGGSDNDGDGIGDTALPYRAGEDTDGDGNIDTHHIKNNGDSGPLIMQSDTSPPVVFDISLKPNQRVNAGTVINISATSYSKRITNCTLNIEGSQVPMNLSQGSYISNCTYRLKQEDISPGYVTYSIEVEDAQGYRGSTERRAFIDSTPPSISLHNPANATLSDPTPLLNATFGEVVDHAWYSVDGGANNTYTSVKNLTVNLSPLSDGTHSLTLYANDTAGNLNYASTSFSVDTTLPLLHTNLTNNSYHSSKRLTFTLEGSDAHLAWLWLYNGSTNTSYSGSNTTFSLSYSSNGSKDLTLYANDTAGNLNYTSTSFSVDTAKPSFGFPEIYKGTTFNNYYTGTIGIRAAASDTTSSVNGSTCSYSLDGGATWHSAGWNGTHCYSAGLTPSSDLSLRFRVQDQAGNTNTSLAENYTYDPTPPTTVSDTPSSWQNTSITVSLSGNDSLSGVNHTSYCVDQSNICTPSTTGTNVEVSTEGTTYVRYRSVDHLGNTEAINSAKVKIDQTPPATTDDAPGSWQDSALTVDLNPSDTLSGVNYTMYRLNDGSWQQGNRVTIAHSGHNKLQYFSVDRGGNSEDLNTAWVKVDRYSHIYENSLDEGTSAYWAHNLDLGNLSHDLSGNDNDGKLYGPDWVDGMFGGALNFDGQDDYLEVDDGQSIGSFEELTVVAVVKSKEDSWARLLEKGSNDRFSLYQSSNGTYKARVFQDGTLYEASSGVDVRDEWYFVALTYNGSVLRAYVNGNQEASTPLTGTINTSGHPLIMMKNASVAHVEGSIDEVIIFNRSLSDSEMQRLYHSYYYTPPTPLNNSNLSRSYIYINITSLPTYDRAKVEFNGTNYSMVCEGNNYYRNITNLSDGHYWFKVYGSYSGDITPQEFRKVTLDNAPPATTDDAPSSWQSDSVTVSLSASDSTSGVATTRYRLDDGAWQEGTSASITAEGNHTLNYYSTDNAGNEEGVSTAYVAIDLTPPALNLLSPQNQSYGTGDVDLNYASSDLYSGVERVWYSLDGGQNLTLGGNTTLDNLSDGSHSITLYANDTAGNLNSASTSFSVDTATEDSGGGGGSSGGGGGAPPDPVTGGFTVLNDGLFQEILHAENFLHRDYVEVPANTLVSLLSISHRRFEYPYFGGLAGMVGGRPEKKEGDVYDMTAGWVLEEYNYASEIIVVRGDIDVDSHAAAALSKADRAPVLLTRPGELPRATLEAIEEIKPSKITIVGGPDAVSEEVEEKLKEKAEVTRLWGPTRVETSVEIARKFALPEYIVVAGWNSSGRGAYMGYIYGAPVLYVRGGEVPGAVEGYLQDKLGSYQKKPKVIFVGVPPGVEEKVEALQGN